jgi:hypothetical protein
MPIWLAIELQFYWQGVSKMQPKLPKGEFPCGIHKTKDKTYQMADNADRSMFFLYEIVDGKLNRIAKNKNIKELEKIVWKDYTPPPTS